ncbi:alpha/beta hydrolase [Stenotrophomonas sp.]|uniref:alpha/beta fold hydrolase n=1 Tax=Stenotrophomonas sp. TaxID=69392 RepID=UPI0028AB8BBF|nr:alpha/beta hydrolase [Stenotrophomonas sp.]
MNPPLRPRVLMLPGLDGGVGMSGAFLEAVRAHGLEAEALSLPVHGAQDYPTLAAWLQPQLPLQPWVLLAESFAGPLAVQIAAQAPAGLRGLVLSTTFARRPVPVPAASAVALSAAWPLPPLPVMARVLLGQWRTPQNVQALRQALAEVPSRVLRQRAASTLRVDVRALLPRIAVPTLYLQARQDRLLWPPSVSELQALLPEARHVALQGPHLLLQARPEQAAEVVARWVNGLPG